MDSKTNVPSLPLKAPISAVLAGAGNRGMDAYGNYALKHPDRIKFIAVAEPDEFKRKLFQKQHKIPDDMAFSSWEDLFNSEKGRLADVAFICTPDLMHYEPAMAALNLGYHLVLEKPIAPTIEQCKEIEALAKEKGAVVQVCHVLRHTDFWKKIKALVSSGRIGRVIHYEHSENVSYWHFSHSYVRGIFSHTDHSAPFVLAKTCHDLDLMYWILGEKPLDVSATGGLTHYREENAPEGAPEYCLQGCPIQDECPWYAPRIYITADNFLQIGAHASNFFLRGMARLFLKNRWLLKIFALFIPPLRQFINWKMWPANQITHDLSIEGKKKALLETPYGKCVYRSYNNQPDHIMGSFTFPSGTTGALISTGLSEHEGRELRIFGSKGTIRAQFRFIGERIWITDFRNMKTELVHKKGIVLEAHGGADTGLMDDFTALMLGEKSEKIDPAAYKDALKAADISEAMESHYMGFAFEKSRLTGEKVVIDDVRRGS